VIMAMAFVVLYSFIIVGLTLNRLMYASANYEPGEARNLLQRWV